MDKIGSSKKEGASSFGHKLGQMIGDWYEEYFALPILQDVARQLNLFCDNRFVKRDCRGEKIIWRDLDGNDVDYDFVLELNGSNEKMGTPIAAFETFWRRGKRHSKDKARDDTGKLIPLKRTYPTARVIGIISAGDFTTPAKELVISRNVDLFYVDKENIISAWKNNGLTIDYPDKSTEEIKSKLAKDVIDAIENDKSILSRIAEELVKLVNPITIEAYKKRLVANIGAIPQRFSIQIQTKSAPIEFNSYTEVDEFLNGEEPNIEQLEIHQLYSYQVQFFNGDEFQRENLDWKEIKELHNNLRELISHLEK